MLWHLSIIRAADFLSFFRRCGDRTSGRAKEHAWGKPKNWGEVGRGWVRRGRGWGGNEPSVASPPPPTAYFATLSEFPPVREHLEKERKQLLRRLIERLSMTFTADSKRQKWNFCRLSSALCTVESKYLYFVLTVRDSFLFLCDLFKDYKKRLENQK